MNDILFNYSNFSYLSSQEYRKLSNPMKHNNCSHFFISTTTAIINTLRLTTITGREGSTFSISHNRHNQAKWHLNCCYHYCSPTANTPKIHNTHCSHTLTGHTHTQQPTTSHLTALTPQELMESLIYLSENTSHHLRPDKKQDNHYITQLPPPPPENQTAWQNYSNYSGIQQRHISPPPPKKETRHSFTK